MNIYGQGQAFYNDLIYPISPMYSTGLAELLDREVDGHDVIEFGVGTGRIAFPLLTRGYNVIGIDRSNAMLNELGHRDEDNLITKVKADLSIPLEALEPHQADVILLVCNAIFEANELAAQRGVLGRQVRGRGLALGLGRPPLALKLDPSAHQLLTQTQVAGH